MSNGRLVRLLKSYEILLVAVSKHFKVLEAIDLIVKRKEGRVFLCQMNYELLTEVSQWIKTYRKFWEAGFYELEV